jgi:hypothetical protein
MSQSKAMSLLEAVVNTVVGLGVAMVATAAICKAYGIPMTWENNFIITFWMTVISIVRSYLLRRLFNGDWRGRLRRFLDRASCWYEQNGRGAPILHSPRPCVGCERCNERDALRAKFDEESA